MDFDLTDEQQSIRGAIRELCGRFPGEYWRALDASGQYPEEFVLTLTELGWLSVLIPESYGGGGMGMTEAGLILEEIHRSGANANACHAQMYTMGALLRHGSDEQKQRYLPAIARGELRLQAFGVTEPDAGSDTTRIRTRAERRGGEFIVTGQKIFTSRVDQSDLMLLLARTGPATEADKTAGLSLFLVDLKAGRDQISTQRIPLMFNHHSYSVYLTDLKVPEANLIGEEGRGFRYLLDGFNAERILIASEAIGDGHFFIDRASAYARTRVVFGRPVGANQGVAFPLAQARAQVEAASLVRLQAATRFDRDLPCGEHANTAKLLASQASWTAANACMAAYGGAGFAAEFDVERKFRESKLLEIAPVSNNLVLAYLAQRVLGLPRSY